MCSGNRRQIYLLRHQQLDEFVSWKHQRVSRKHSIDANFLGWINLGGFLPFFQHDFEMFEKNREITTIWFRWYRQAQPSWNQPSWTSLPTFSGHSTDDCMAFGPIGQPQVRNPRPLLARGLLLLAAWSPWTLSGNATKAFRNEWEERMLNLRQREITPKSRTLWNHEQVAFESLRRYDVRLGGILF